MIFHSARRKRQKSAIERRKQPFTEPRKTAEDRLIPQITQTQTPACAVAHAGVFCWKKRTEKRSGRITPSTLFFI